MPYATELVKLRLGRSRTAQPYSDFYVRGMERLVRAVEELSLARSLDAVQEIARSGGLTPIWSGA